MKKIYIYLLLAIMASGCSKDFGTKEVSFTKALAIYGNLSEIRATPLKSELRSIENPGKIYISQSTLLIGEEQKGIHVFDNTDPSSPSPLYFLNVPGNKEFYVDEGFIYADSYYDMLKIDFQDRSNPSIKSRVENYMGSALINDESEAVIGFDYEKVTIDISEDDESFWEEFYNYDAVFFDYKNTIIPNSAVPSSFAGSGESSSGSVNRITRAKEHVYVIHLDRLFVFSDEEELVHLGTHHDVWGMETIFPNNDNLFIGAQQSVSIMDITEPSNPRYVSSFFHNEACDPVYPYDDVAYITLRSGDDDLCPGDENALVTLDITSLDNPMTTKTIEMESPYGLTVIDQRLYVGEGFNGMKIFDISDVYIPELIKSIDNISAFDIIAHPIDQNLILVAGPDGFIQYEVDSELSFDEVSRVSY